MAKVPGWREGRAWGLKEEPGKYGVVTLENRHASSLGSSLESLLWLNAARVKCTEDWVATLLRVFTGILILAFSLGMSQIPQSSPLPENQHALRRERPTASFPPMWGWGRDTALCLSSSYVLSAS